MRRESVGVQMLTNPEYQIQEVLKEKSDHT